MLIHCSHVVPFCGVTRPVVVHFLVAMFFGLLTIVVRLLLHVYCRVQVARLLREQRAVR